MVLFCCCFHSVQNKEILLSKIRVARSDVRFARPKRWLFSAPAFTVQRKKSAQMIDRTVVLTRRKNTRTYEASPRVTVQMVSVETHSTEVLWAAAITRRRGEVLSLLAQRYKPTLNYKQNVGLLGWFGDQVTLLLLCIWLTNWHFWVSPSLVRKIYWDLSLLPDFHVSKVFQVVRFLSFWLY